MRSTPSITALVCIAILMAACSGGGGQGAVSSGGGSAVIGTGGDGSSGGGTGNGGPGDGDPDSPFRIINAVAVPDAGGSVTGAGQYDTGATATLQADPNPGYVFASWFEDDTAIASDTTLSFKVTRNRDLAALFRTQTELLTGIFSGVPKGADAPGFDILSISGTQIVLLHVDARTLSIPIDLTEVPWCRYEGTLSGIELPATASGTFECRDGEESVKGNWFSEHVAKTDFDAFIIEIEADPNGAAAPWVAKYSGFMTRREEDVAAHHHLLAPYSVENAAPGNLTGRYRGYMKIGRNGDGCAPHDFDMVSGEFEISAGNEGLIEIGQIPDLGVACAFSGTIADIGAMPLAATGTYDCDAPAGGDTGDTGTWTGTRIALTSDERDSILVDLEIDVPARGCEYRARYIGFRTDD